MDYKKDCEERLRRYAKAEETLEFLNKRLEKASMHGKPADLSAIDFSKIGHSNMSKDALDELLEVQHILKQIDKLKNEKEIIDDILNKIKGTNAEEYKFITLRYFEDMPMFNVSEKLGYSDTSLRTVYKIREKALGKFSLYFWGK